jgi:hypothetical protein
MRSWSCQKEACLLWLGRIVGKQEVIGYFLFARHPLAMLPQALWSFQLPARRPQGDLHTSGLPVSQVSKAGGRIIWSFVSPHALASCGGPEAGFACPGSPVQTTAMGIGIYAIGPNTPGRQFWRHSWPLFLLRPSHSMS